jgi:hypothetical protein
MKVKHDQDERKKQQREAIQMLFSTDGIWNSEEEIEKQLDKARAIKLLTKLCGSSFNVLVMKAERFCRARISINIRRFALSFSPSNCFPFWLNINSFLSSDG